ncbi:MAG: GNAT family N-acetyltransferase, partial [Myxococcota bacterium]
LDALVRGPFRGCELRHDPDDAAWSDALGDRGWHDLGVRERWAGSIPERREDPAFVPVAACGWTAFTERLTAVLAAAPSRFGADGAALVDAWSPFGPGEDERFGLVGDFGIVAPRCVEPGVGAMLFVGVLPGRRGGGLGRRTYDAGLARLRSAGLEHTEDEVEATNAPMRALFQSLGLECVARWRGWVEGP